MCPFKLENLRIVLSKAIQDLRGLSHVLNKDSVLKEGLYNSIQAQLQYLKQNDAFETAFKVVGDPVAFKPSKRAYPVPHRSRSIKQHNETCPSQND